jgi:hypothetical protein
MPASAIPGFVKKRTASQTFKRSPRQLTRDITLAVELQDEKILSNLRVRTEDGEDIDGKAVTKDLIKSLRDEGRNPMWYLRRSWLEEEFGKREGTDPQTSTDAELNDHVSKSPKKTETLADEGLTEMLKESIQELKRDKEHLIGQLKIKDAQIESTTERWKESNVLTQNLHKRIETMESQMKRLMPSSVDTDPTQETHASIVVEAEEKGTSPKRKSATPAKTHSPVKTSTTKKRKARKQVKRKPKWYETPTLNKMASRFRSR